MSAETTAALAGAFVGWILSMATNYFTEMKKKQESVSAAIDLFLYLNKRWEVVEGLSGGSASQKKDYPAIITIAERIKETIVSSGNPKLISLFLQYWSQIEEANTYLQAGNLGLQGYPVESARKTYKEFENLVSQMNCC